ncbi:MAG: hypothetical protein H0X00_05025 [Sporichthya sp.]|nr:hypothetical protein [Sporichthya sp.]MBA3742287.1 hypothetical protein [Sporichthya sp.]
MPYSWVTSDSPEGERLLHAAQLDAKRLPVVMTPAGDVLVAPSTAELATAVGLSTGGDLSVQSVPGDTRFIVRLPLTEREKSGHMPSRGLASPWTSDSQSATSPRQQDFIVPGADPSTLCPCLRGRRI